MVNQIPQHAPLVSVILPVFNEQDYIWRTLSSIRNQVYPADKIEVLVVDGISQDHTKEKVNQFVNQYPQLNIRLFNNPRGIYSTGFNIGLQYARGEVVIMMGGHTEPAPDYISRCVENLFLRGVDCVGGSLQTIADSYSGQVIAAAMGSSFGVGGVAFRTRSNQAAEVDTVAFAAYRRSSIERCGFMDEELVRDQDDEYNYRLREMGGIIFLAPDIHARYYSRSSLSSLWRQYYQYGLWKVRVLQKHPRQMQIRQFIPPLFVLSLLSSALLILLTPWAWVVLFLVVVSYSVANIGASYALARQKGWKYLPLLPVTYIILHISYGLGLIMGLIKFINRWKDKKGIVPDYSHFINKTKDIPT